MSEEGFFTVYPGLKSETNWELLNFGSCSIKGERAILTEISEIYDTRRGYGGPFTISTCQVTLKVFLVTSFLGIESGIFADELGPLGHIDLVYVQMLPELISKEQPQKEMNRK